MNDADIKAAQRLIAQFEGDALGRHNSSKFRNNPTKEQEPTYREPAFENSWHIIFARHWTKCRIGEVVIEPPTRNISGNLVRVIPYNQNNLNMWGNNDMDALVTVDIWEFERIAFRYGDRLYPTNVWETGWKRIA